MSNQKSSYRKILQATSVFGGVQLFTVLISLVRSKLIAILLGPAGMGIAGMFATSISLISSLTNLGINSVAVKDISEANSSKNQEKLARITVVVNKWVWFTGLLGMFTTIIASPILSQMVFNNNKYILSFILLGGTLLINQISQGQLIFLQGTQKIKELAKANIFSIVFSFVCSIPIYFVFKTDGIVPALIITSISGFLITNYFYRKNKIREKVSISYNNIFLEGKAMAKMGITVSMAIFITEGLTYLLRLYITRSGGLEDVGYYGAGFTIITGYVGLVFSAMGTDYFPRLSAVSNNDKASNELINQQAELSLIILGPIVTIFLVFIKFIILIIYSEDFLPIVGMMQWAIMGIIFKAVSWAMAFLFLARGASKFFFWNELAASSYMLVLNILGYHFFKLDGLGISFLLSYFLYAIQVYFIVRKKYEFRFSSEILKILIINILLISICFILQKNISEPYNYFVGGLIIFFSLIYSFMELDKRINLKEIMLLIKNKFTIK